MITKENNFEYLFCMQKTRPKKEDQIDKKKKERKSGFTILFFVSDHVEAANIIQKNIGSNRTVL